MFVHSMNDRMHKAKKYVYTTRNKKLNEKYEDKNKKWRRELLLNTSLVESPKID